MDRPLKDELVERVTAYSRCWLEGRPADLRAFLHPDVVFTGPQFQRLAKGAEPCVQSYVKFLAQARIHDCKASNHVVDVAGHTAVMTYRWTIDYEIGGSRYSEAGQDLLVWVRQGERWLIAWRAQQPDPASPPG